VAGDHKHLALARVGTAALDAQVVDAEAEAQHLVVALDERHLRAVALRRERLGQVVHAQRGEPHERRRDGQGDGDDQQADRDEHYHAEDQLGPLRWADILYVDVGVH